jgi:hypothetical protein
MPKEFIDCVAAMKREGKGDSAYAICTDAYKKSHGGRTPQEDHGKHSFTIDITVASFVGIKQVDIKPIDEGKGVYGIYAGEKIIQYKFCKFNPADWTLETSIGYIEKLNNKEVHVSCAIDVEITQSIRQTYSNESIMAALPDDFKTKLIELKDPDPGMGLGVLRIKYGKGSNKQILDREFFQAAGAKFEGKPFLWNHSDLGEFGKAVPVGTLPKFLGATEDGADYIYYVSPSEGTLRQKIKESVTLGDYGYVRKVSIEGGASKADYTTDGDGWKHMKDITTPSGIALVNIEGMKGSQIIT